MARRNERRGGRPCHQKSREAAAGAVTRPELRAAGAPIVGPSSERPTPPREAKILPTTMEPFETFQGGAGMCDNLQDAARDASEPAGSVRRKYLLSSQRSTKHRRISPPSREAARQRGTVEALGGSSLRPKRWRNPQPTGGPKAMEERNISHRRVRTHGAAEMAGYAPRARRITLDGMAVARMPHAASGQRNRSLPSVMTNQLTKSQARPIRSPRSR